MKGSAIHHATASGGRSSVSYSKNSTKKKDPEAGLPRMKEVNATIEARSEKTHEQIVKERGVAQSVYLGYIKGELDSESACLELPLTFLLLVAFAVMAISYLRQDQIYSLEHAVDFDITENANFAWAHNMGHKGIVDVNSYADFWSWARLGFLPLVVQPFWAYSEDYPAALGTPVFMSTPYDKGMLPYHYEFEGYDKKAPMKNDYLRFNRVIGGIRMATELAPASYESCRLPGSIDRSLMERWLGKPCARSTIGELSIEMSETETLDNPRRVEWLIPELDSLDELRTQLIDMEDGCARAAAAGDLSTCRCVSCRQPRQPWLDEEVVRIEIAMVLFNPTYGVYSYVGVNFFFNRGGAIKKFINIMSAWADLSLASLSEQITIYTSCGLWTLALLYVFVNETREIIGVIRNSKERCWVSLKEDYLAPWNVVDWVSFIVGVVMISLYMRMRFATGEVNTQFGMMMESSNNLPAREEYQARIESFFDKVNTMNLAERDFRRSLCVYPSIVMLRLFKSFAAQPRLALVTSTLAQAAPDMMHFFIVFGSVYFCMMVNSVLFFGQDSMEFTTFFRASHTCFLAMFGDWDWDRMQEIGYFKASVWFWLFMLVMVLVLLNMLLAIIMEVYTTEKKKAEDQATLFRQVTEMWRRRREFTKGERVRLNDIMDAFQKEYDGDIKGMLNCERILTPDFIIQHVPKIQRKQAQRLLVKAVEHVDKVANRNVTESDVQEQINKTLQHSDRINEEIAGSMGYVRNLAWRYDKLEVPGDEEFVKTFGVTEDDEPIARTTDKVTNAVSEASTEIGRLFLESMKRVHDDQLAFERQQDELHEMIAEIQLMVAQQAGVIEELTELTRPVRGTGGALMEPAMPPKPLHALPTSNLS